MTLYRAVKRSGNAEAHEASLHQVDLPWLAAAVGMGGIVGLVLLMFGPSLISASSGALLLNLEGLATMAIVWLAFKVNVDRRLLFATMAILAGAVLLTWQGQGVDFNSRALPIAGACLTWGIDNNLTRKISAADPTVIAMIKGLVAGVVNIGLALTLGASLQTIPLIEASAMLGLFGVGVSLVMFILALRHLGIARTDAHFSLAPFIGAF